MKRNVYLIELERAATSRTASETKEDAKARERQNVEMGTPQDENQKTAQETRLEKKLKSPVAPLSPHSHHVIMTEEKDPFVKKMLVFFFFCASFHFWFF